MTGSVLHVLKTFRPTFTGAGILLERMTPIFAALAPTIQHDLLVVETPCPTVPVEVNSAFRKIVYLQNGNTSTWQRELLLLWWLVRNIRQYQVIHFHTHVDRYFLAYLLAKLFRKRLVLSATLDDSVPNLVGSYRCAYRPLISALIRLFDVFIAISPKLHAESAAIVGPENVRMIPIGVAVPAETRHGRQTTRAACGLTDDDIVLIFVGGICARKDPLFLVEQMPAIRALCPRSKLVVVGPVLEPDHHEQMMACVREHRLENAVLFTGEVRDPYPLLAMADIMVFASHLEGFGSAVTEGMAHGLVPVVRHLPGVNDMFIRQNETGFLFTSAEEYLTALRQLIGDPALRHQIGAAARSLILAEFDNVRFAHRVLETYRFGRRPADSGEVHV
jgi:glycosyltransferase involved in cell wall biosynthesis